MDEPTRPRRRISTRKKALFLLLFVVALLGLSEFLLHLAVADTEIRVRLRRGGYLLPYYPNTEAEIVAKEFRVRYAINEWGYRDRRGREVTRPGGPEVRRRVRRRRGTARSG